MSGSTKSAKSINQSPENEENQGVRSNILLQQHISPKLLKNKETDCEG